MMSCIQCSNFEHPKGLLGSTKDTSSKTFEYIPRN
jgi:hypothetical protein